MNEVDKEQSKIKKEIKPQVQGVDLIDYAMQLWMSRKFLLKSCGIGAIIGLIVAVSIPKTYTTSAILAPELDKLGGGQMSAIANMMGMRGLDQQLAGISLIKAEKIVKSTPFMLELIDTKVRKINSTEEITIVDYLRQQKSPWWNKILALPSKAIGGILSLVSHRKSSPQKEIERVPYQLTRKEAIEIAALKQCITVKFNKKAGDISIATTFQDPMVCKLMADSVMQQLQDYMIDYQTNKAKTDYEFLMKLYKRKQQDYFDAQDIFAKFVDGNHKLVRQSASVERTKLQNDVNLCFQMYSQVASQLQIAEAKVQEDKPVFAVLEPAVVPLVPSGFGKLKIVMVWIFLTFAAASGWVIFGKDLLTSLKKITSSEEKKL